MWGHPACHPACSFAEVCTANCQAQADAPAVLAEELVMSTGLYVIALALEQLIRGSFPHLTTQPGSRSALCYSHCVVMCRSCHATAELYRTSAVASLPWLLLSATPVFQLPSCLKLLPSFPSSLLAFSRFFVKSFLKTNQ